VKRFPLNLNRIQILNHHTAGSPIDAEIKWTNISLKEISKAFESKGMNI